MPISLYLQTRQNVVDVNHHVTQYLHIIDALQYQVVRLRSQLDKTSVGGVAGSDEVRVWCEELRTLAQDQKKIRSAIGVSMVTCIQ